MMRFLKFVIAAMSVLLTGLNLPAQITVNYDEFRISNSIEVVIVDEETSSPIVGASVYIIPSAHSTITKFTFSDKNGKAVLEGIDNKTYDIYVEMLGYKPVHLTKTISGKVDLGVIKLSMDPQTIDPATIKAYIKPLEIRNDTLVYSAAAFPVMGNAALEDLIKRMPGLKIEENGDITANGLPVNRITVEGKTFFFDAPLIVLRSLPARVIDKILLFDSKSNEHDFSGIESGKSRWKTLDIQLKEEFIHALFGRVAVGAGATLNNKDDEILHDEEKVLFNTNVLISNNSSLDQVTIVGIGNNDGSQSGGRVVGTNSRDEFDNRKGVTSAVKVGANLNTMRIKGVETNASVSYYGDSKTVEERTVQSSLVNEEENLVTNRTYSGKGSADMISTSLRLTNQKKGNYYFEILPVISFSRKNRYSEQASANVACSTITASTASEDIEVNAGLKDIGGKNKRTVNVSGKFSSYQMSSNELRDILSDSYLKMQLHRKNNGFAVSGNFTYSEPLSARWTVQGRVGLDRQSFRDQNNAEDRETKVHNDHYSSMADESRSVLSERLTLQYRNGLFRWTFGPIFEQSWRTFDAVSLSKHGKGSNHDASLSPFMNLGYDKDNYNISIEYDGRTILPANDQILPQVDIQSQTNGQVGNIYLASSYVHSVFPYATIRTEDNLFVSASSGIIVTTRPITYAFWADESSQSFILPVNAQKPQTLYSLSTNLSKVFGEKGNWDVAMDLSSSYSSSATYLSATARPTTDIQQFDYLSTLGSIYRDSTGMEFYSGNTGFKEILVTSTDSEASIDAGYRTPSLSIRAGCLMNYYTNAYSGVKSSSANWLNYELHNSFIWKNSIFQIEGDMKFKNYSWIENDFAKPECLVDMILTKDLGKASASLVLRDIFNQRRSYLRIADGNMIRDQFSNALGRTILLNIAFSFGSYNAHASQKANDAVHYITY